MMLCVISYWVLSGAKRRQIQQLRCCAFPAKLLKRRDVYLKLTRHNGRAGAHGTYNPKHNDRSFNLANSEHIDPERAKGNIYWDCFHGFRSALDPQDPDDLAATFSDVERQFYESRYTAFVESQNERNAKIRHTERNRSIPDLLSSRKTCPEETIYQLGTLDEHASAEDLLNIVTEFIEEFKAKFGEHVHVLDWALHLDESMPHIHERHVFDCQNRYGELCPQQEKALEELGIPAQRTVETNEYLQTLYPNIYAAGDVAGPFQFTHTAAHQAWYAAVNALFGDFKKFKADYSVIPWATFIDPEVARVGLNEQEAKEKNIPYEVTKYGIDDLDRAIADSEAHGFVKVLTVPGKDQILGVTIVGEHAADLLSEYVLAMKHGLGLNKILGTIHIYPTLAEANKYVAGVWKKAHAPQELLRWIERLHTWRRGGG